MGVLTADTTHATRPRAGRDAYTVLDAKQLYAGGLVGVDAAGYLTAWADTADLKFQGLLLEGVLGDITPAGGAVIPSGRVNTKGDTLESAVVASAVQGSVNALVYCTTDNPADMTLVPTTFVSAVGWVRRYVSAGVADVELFQPSEVVTAVPEMYTLVFFTDLATVSDADIVTDYIIGHKFKLVKLDVIVETAATTAAKLSTIDVEIGAVAVTGGEVALTSANMTPKGKVKAGVAISGANTGGATDTVTILASSTTAFIEGSVWIALQIQNMD